MFANSSWFILINHMKLGFFSDFPFRFGHRGRMFLLHDFSIFEVIIIKTFAQLLLLISSLAVEKFFMTKSCWNFKQIFSSSYLVCSDHYYYFFIFFLRSMVSGLAGKVDFTVRHLSSPTRSFPSNWTDFSSSQPCIVSNFHQVCSLGSIE